MKLTNLEKIYTCIKTENETYFIFEFVKNGVKFEMLFDIFKIPFQLHFIQKASDFHFKVFVEKGFEINPILDKLVYSSLCKVLNLKYNENNKFSTTTFFQEFNNVIRNDIIKFLKKSSSTKFVVFIVFKI